MDAGTVDRRPPGRPVRGARRAATVTVVASLVVAAAVGIAALLSGEFGELHGRIVLTALVVAAAGTTALCHLAVVTRAVRLVGLAGLAGSAGAAACALVLVWRDTAAGSDDGLVRALVLLTVLAVGLAHANLLLLLAGRRHPAVRTGLAVTLVAVATVAVMIVVPVLTDGRVPGEGEWYWRWLGVAGIVDALGTVALPVLGAVLRPGRPATVRLVLDLPPDLAARLDDRAGDGTREAAALDGLRRGLG